MESGERVFALAHNEFVKFVHSDQGFSQRVRALHREIAATAKARGWKERDLENAVDLYEVLYTANHDFFAGQWLDADFDGSRRRLAFGD